MVPSLHSYREAQNTALVKTPVYIKASMMAMENRANYVLIGENFQSFRDPHPKKADRHRFLLCIYDYM